MYDNQIPLSCVRLKLSPWSFQSRFKSEWNYCEVNYISKALRFLKKRAEHKNCPVLYWISKYHKNFIPKYLHNPLIDFAPTSRTSRQLLEENAPANDFGLQVVRCYDNSDVIATLTQFGLMSRDYFFSMSSHPLSLQPLTGPQSNIRLWKEGNFSEA